MEQKAVLTDLRNEFYDKMPKGQIDAWQMIAWASDVFKSLDKFIDAMPEQPFQSPMEESNGEKLADKWVFETNGHKWSNNDNTAGDNYGSFLAGYKAGTAVTPPQSVKGLRWSWKLARDHYPQTREWVLVRLIGSVEAFPALFSTHIICDHAGKTYSRENVEYLCEDNSPSDTQAADAVVNKMADFIRDLTVGWDCDNDSHKYDTPCRKCEAKRLYDLYTQSLNKS